MNFDLPKKKINESPVLLTSKEEDYYIKFLP